MIELKKGMIFYHRGPFRTNCMILLGTFQKPIVYGWNVEVAYVDERFGGHFRHSDEYAAGKILRMITENYWVLL